MCAELAPSLDGLPLPPATPSEPPTYLGFALCKLGSKLGEDYLALATSGLVRRGSPVEAGAPEVGI